MNLKYSRCQLLACPELLPPENGRFVHHQKCSNVFNSACGLQCNSGFELQNGSPVRICLPNGHWSGMQPRWLIIFFTIFKMWVLFWSLTFLEWFYELLFSAIIYLSIMPPTPQISKPSTIPVTDLSFCHIVCHFCIWSVKINLQNCYFF